MAHNRHHHHSHKPAACLYQPPGPALWGGALHPPGPPTHRIFAPVCWAHLGGGLTAADYAEAAKALACEVAVIQAIAQNETPRGPWDEDGRPTILYERHYFSRLTCGFYDKTHPDISAPTPYKHYGPFRAQYERLRAAAELDQTAALKSASWGMFQVMGANHVAAGYATVDGFVDAMMADEKRQLDAFVAYVKASSPALVKAMQGRDWAVIARYFNGPNYAKNEYDAKLKAAYTTLAPPPRVPAH